MYPVGRILGEIWRIRKQPKLAPFAQHSTQIRIYPWDLDFFFELNNGRTLTLYDIPRVALAVRTGLWELAKEKGLGMAVAGVSVRYRKRITIGQKITMTAQCIGFDDRFFYILQNTFRGEEACGQSLARLAFSKSGIVPPLEAFGERLDGVEIPELPEWVTNFSQSANQRPWPPERAEHE